MNNEFEILAPFMNWLMILSKAKTQVNRLDSKEHQEVSHVDQLFFKAFSKVYRKVQQGGMEGELTE